MLYLQPPTNTDVTFPAERQILSLLSTLCPGQRAIMWGSSNGRRGEQRGAWLTDLFQSSCSLGQGVRQLACAFFESSIPRTAPRARCCVGKGNLLCMGHTHTHTKQKAVCANVVSGQGALRKKGREHISPIGWRLFPQQAAAAERVWWNGEMSYI